jgi:hypothetical protein
MTGLALAVVIVAGMALPAGSVAVLAVDRRRPAYRGKHRAWF